MSGTWTWLDGKVQRSSVVISVGLSNLHFVSPATSFSITAQFDEEILNSLSMVFGPSCEWAEYHFQTNFCVVPCKVVCLGHHVRLPCQQQLLTANTVTTSGTFCWDLTAHVHTGPVFRGLLEDESLARLEPTSHFAQTSCLYSSLLGSPASSQSMLHILRRHHMSCPVR